MDYLSSFLQIKFPTTNFRTVLVKYEDIERIVGLEVNGKLEVRIYLKSLNGGYWRFDGSMEEFKKNCETVRL